VRGCIERESGSARSNAAKLECSHVEEAGGNEGGEGHGDRYMKSPGTSNGRSSSKGM